MLLLIQRLLRSREHCYFLPSLLLCLGLTRQNCVAFMVHVHVNLVNNVSHLIAVAWKDDWFELLGLPAPSSPTPGSNPRAQPSWPGSRSL